MNLRFRRVLGMTGLLFACQACSQWSMPGGGGLPFLGQSITREGEDATFDRDYVGDTERGHRFLANGDPVSAAREFHGPALQGDASAAMALAELYARGRGLTRDPEKALYWYSQAADAGPSEAKVALGRQLWFGEWIAPDAAAAVGWWEKASRGGDKEANYLLGQVYLGGLSPASGQQPVVVDATRAAAFFRVAAESGHRAASACLASLYEAGHGVPRDLASAEYWYGKAAEGPSAETAFELSRFYASPGTPVQDLQKSLFWMRRAAEAGFEPAIRSLAGMEREAHLAEGSLVLLGQPVSMADRQSVRRALAAREITVLDERDDAWYDLYDSRRLWSVTDRLWLGYTLSGGKLASLRYRIPQGDSPALLGRVRSELAARHGKPVRESETSAFGGTYAEWQHKDVTIRLIRGEAGTLFVTYSIQPAYAALSREQGVRDITSSGASTTWVAY